MVEPAAPDRPRAQDVLLRPEARRDDRLLLAEVDHGLDRHEDLDPDRDEDHGREGVTTRALAARLAFQRAGENVARVRAAPEPRAEELRPFRAALRPRVRRVVAID